MSDRAQVKALAEELAKSSTYSLQISDLRQEIIRQVEKAHPPTLAAVAATMGIRNTPAHSKPQG